MIERIGEAQNLKFSAGGSESKDAIDNFIIRYLNETAHLLELSFSM